MGRGNVTPPPPPWWELGPKYLSGNRVNMQIEIIAAIFDWISKQQLNLSLFLSYWYCRKLWLTDLPGRDRKVRSHMHFILSPYEKPQSADRGFYMNRCLIKGCYWRRRETRNMNAQYYAHISERNEPCTQPFDKQCFGRQLSVVIYEYNLNQLNDQRQIWNILHFYPLKLGYF